MLHCSRLRAATRTTNRNEPQRTMSNTATATSTAADPRITGLNPDLTILFARTEAEITLRLDAWVQSETLCWVILSTGTGACVEVFGRLDRLAISYRLKAGESTIIFPLTAVESVGHSCIFLKSL